MNRVVVLTGASSGLGRAAALRLARRGYRLALLARGEDALNETARRCTELGAEVLVLPTDVCVESEVQAAARETLRRYGAIDIWINNAGATLFAPLEEGDFAPHRRVIEINLFGAMHGARAVVPVFRRQGRGVLVNLGSVLSGVGQAFVPSYVISKFAVRGLSEALRVELADCPDIHVCTLLPYAIDTPHFEHGANHLAREMHPLPPVQDPDTVARALVQLVERPRRVRHVPRIAALGLALHAWLPRATEKTLLEALRRWHQGRSGPRGDGNLYDPSPGSGAIHGSRAPLVSTVRLSSWAVGRMLTHLAGGLLGRA